MERNAHLDPDAVPLAAGGTYPDALSRADALLDKLAAEHGGRRLPEHAEVLEAVHQALVDTLGRTES